MLMNHIDKLKKVRRTIMNVVWRMKRQIRRIIHSISSAYFTEFREGLRERTA